jgi:glycogen phosphorylase
MDSLLTGTIVNFVLAKFPLKMWNEINIGAGDQAPCSEWTFTGSDSGYLTGPRPYFHELRGFVQQEKKLHPDEKAVYLNELKNLNVLANELRQLSRNLWWTWEPEAQEIFSELSPQLWTQSNHNAVAVLNSFSAQELKTRLMEKDFANRVSATLVNFKEYLTRKRTWCSAHAAPFLKSPIAYFTAEFGLHESLPTYSGGLGILSGDHAKSASGLGLPFVGISLFYKQGYFQQLIAADGWQEESYPTLDRSSLPLDRVLDSDGHPLILSVEIAHSQVKVQAWQLNVGSIVIYLLDTELPENEEHYRSITARVYGGDSTTRIGQEIVMGIGGIRLLRALGIQPSVFHMNEGHSAFLTLELLREQLAKGKSLKEAQARVKECCVFTTHTPVAAGHDRFKPELMEYALGHFRTSLNLSATEFLGFGRVDSSDEEETFCMTVLALKLSRAANAVSELHGEVSREMWKDFSSLKEAHAAPIGHITNGIHVLGWITRPTRRFWQTHLGEDWETKLLYPDLWKIVSDHDAIPDEEIWALRYRLKRQLIEFARRRLREQTLRAGQNNLRAYEKILNTDALTICFARRFATYKRAPLIFHDLKRIEALLNNPEKPLQLLFAGKAHPRDDEGKEYLTRIIEITKRREFFGKVIFLENYDINLARHLVSGADVWLNTPRRPLEASGTSGQKVCVHGGLNLSILDGWWCEGYDGTNGWAIGSSELLENPDQQDEADAASLYEILEQAVIPLYFDKDENGIPVQWIEYIRRSMQTLIPQFNTDRMVAEYVTKYYLSRGKPSIEKQRK